MNKLFRAIQFDREIIDVMRNIDPFKSQWSNDLIDTSLSLINHLRAIDCQFQIQSIDCESVELSSSDRKKLGHYETFNLIFSNYAYYQSFIFQYLTPHESQIVQKIHDKHLIDNHKDYYYMIAHLPFYHKLIKLINSFIIENSLPKLNGLPEKFNSIYFKLLSNNFLPVIIYQWIINHCQTVMDINIVVVCQNQKISTNIQILCCDLSTDNLKVIKTISNNLCYLFSLYKINNNNPLHVIYIPTPFKKKINNFKKKYAINNLLISQLITIPSLSYNYQKFTNPISNLTINGGSTNIGLHSDYIIVWRSEEFAKVLIHELIHYYRLEKIKYFDLSKVTLNISNNYDHYPMELFTELQTWFVYTIINLSKKNFEYTQKDLRFILNYERLYSLLNIVKILRHYNLINFNQFKNLPFSQTLTQVNQNVYTKTFSSSNKYMINANSSVIYYYILKGIFLFEIDASIEAILLPNKHNTHIIPLKNNDVEDEILSRIESKQLEIFINLLFLMQPKLKDTMKMMSLSI